MQIRQLTERDFDEQISLSEFAFQYRLTADERDAKREKFRPEQSWGAFDEQDRLLSQLTILPLECWVGGRALRMGGIAGVSTWPEARRMNCVTQLLANSLSHMREQGQTISMLHPFSVPFYRKFGWELTIEQKKYEVETALLPKRKDGPGRMEAIDKRGESLNELYETFASSYQGALKRDADWWANRVLVKPGRVSAWRNEDGALEGYLFYEAKEGVVTVRDWAALNEEARSALWTFLANHDSMAKTIRLEAPIDDGISFLLPDPRGVKQEIRSYFMSRIVDVEGFVRQYPFAEAPAKEELTIRVTDEHAPWNHNVFKITWEKDGKVSAAATEGEAEASCHIRALAAMLLGNRRPEWLYRSGLLAGSPEAAKLLERRIPVHTPFLPDFF
jgi:Predicted acetyltransferase involved in intracellular survival and related acetyltransferases